MISVPNSIVLMFVRGWQGGTIHQIAAELGVTPIEIERADMERMGELMRLAQQRQRDETRRYYGIDVVRFSPGDYAGIDADGQVRVGYSGTGHLPSTCPSTGPVDR